jgi:hypothetical protein
MNIENILNKENIVNIEDILFIEGILKNSNIKKFNYKVTNYNSTIITIHNVYVCYEIYYEKSITKYSIKYSNNEYVNYLYIDNYNDLLIIINILLSNNNFRIIQGIAKFDINNHVNNINYIINNGKIIYIINNEKYLKLYDCPFDSKIERNEYLNSPLILS